MLSLNVTLYKAHYDLGAIVYSLNINQNHVFIQWVLEFRQLMHYRWIPISRL